MNEKPLDNNLMFSFEQIMQLIDKVSESNLDEVKFETETARMCFVKKGKKVLKTETVSDTEYMAEEKKSVEVNAQKLVVEDEKNIYLVKSPIVGTFYSSKEEGGEPLVKVGDTVKKDSIVAIIEAMKLMNEITAGSDGVVAEIMVENGQIVEYGQPLMKIKF